MNCAFDKEKLTGYYDGELDAAEKAEVERHIASCSECLRELGELKSAAVLVKELPRLRAPRSIAEGVSREIQAAGKVHSFAKVRRTVMWAASAAAVLLVVLNVVYFTGVTRSPEMTAAKGPSVGPTIGLSQPSEKREALEQGAANKSAAPARTAAPAAEEERAMERGRRAEMRKDLGGPEGKKLDEAQAGRKAAEEVPADAPKARDRENNPLGNTAKVEEKSKAVVAPAPGAEPSKPAPPPAPKPEAPIAKSPGPRPAADPAAAADKAPQKKDADGLAAGGKQEESKLKKPSAAEPAADAGPAHLTLASTQAAKSRAQLEESLRKMGALPPPAPAATMKGAARAVREETVWQVELTDAQIARLRSELEKPGTALFIAGRPEDPVMAQFRRGGVYEAKKESSAAVASGGAAAPKKAFDAKQPEGKSDSKESDDHAARTPAQPAEGQGEKVAGEPRRKLTLHLMEVPTLQTQPAPDPVKK
jgi:hypothetical protein